MDSVLQSIVTVNKKTQKELGEQTKLLERIAATQDKMAGISAKKAAADARAARASKRNAGDRDIVRQLAQDNKKGKGGVIGGLKSFYEASTEKIAELNQYIEDFTGIDISEFNIFETEMVVP